MLTKEEYILSRIRSFISFKMDDEESINPFAINELIEQWSFDYDMKREFRPHILEKRQENENKFI